MDSLLITPLTAPQPVSAGGDTAEVAENKKQDEKYNKLITQKSKAVAGGPHYWNHFQPVRVDDKDLVKLKCSHCGSMVSAVNPSANMPSHLGSRNCNVAGKTAKRILEQASSKAGKKVKTALDNAATFTGGAEDAARHDSILASSGKSTRSSQKEITEVMFHCSKHQQTIIRGIVGDLIVENPDKCAFNLVHEHQFKKLLELFGVPPISRQWVAGSHLNSSYAAVEAEMKSLLATGFYQLSTDCWKKNNVNDKQKLIGFTANHSEGRTMLVDIACVENGDSVTGDYLMAMIEKAILNLGDVKKCIGVISDREAAVQKALRNLEEKYPWMINLPCQAHGLNLAVKDLQKADQLLSWVLTTSHNIVLWCARPDVRPVLRNFQRQEYRKEKYMEVGVETRFATCIRELSCVVDSKAALQRLTSVPAIASKYQTERNGGKKEYVQALGAVANVNFWTAAEQALDLLNPISDIIHHIEADKPYISQVYRIWNLLGCSGMLYCHSNLTTIYSCLVVL